MSADITSVDLVAGGVIVSFTDGSAAFYDADFLHAHRSSKGNSLLPEEQEPKPTAPVRKDVR
jgi:hypothetical protein